LSFVSLIEEESQINLQLTGKISLEFDVAQVFFYSTAHMVY